MEQTVAAISDKPQGQPPSPYIKFVRPHLWGLAPYVGVEPPEELARKAGLPLDRIVKLNANENPYGPSPKVARGLAAGSNYHIYPDPEQRVARQALAEYAGADVGPEHIVVGAGSDELIELLLRLFVGPGDLVVDCPPTFGYYTFAIGVAGGKVVEAPRDAEFNLDLEAFKEAVAAGAKLAFVASPNNPTGNVLYKDQVEKLLETGIIVVMDEAYYEFCGVTMVHLMPKHDNLVVLRSFSKWAGLAGLRLGYGFFPVWMADLIRKIKPPYSLNAAAQVALLESLADREHLKGTVRAIVAEQERLMAALKEMSFLKVYPSQANFILCAVKDGEALSLVQSLEKKGIYLRYYNTPRLKDNFRISVGKPEDSETLLKALTDWGRGKGLL